jgi:transposase InsO family protein
MAEHGIICSMSRSGNVWDNAAMESFFSSLKTERIARKVYRTRDDARADVFDYIERFYNPRRRHSAIDISALWSSTNGTNWLNLLSIKPAAAQFGP